MFVAAKFEEIDPPKATAAWRGPTDFTEKGSGFWISEIFKPYTSDEHLVVFWISPDFTNENLL